MLRTIPDGVALVAVSKFHPVADLRQAYEAGQRLFGESRVQELVAKIPQMPSDVRWHFIGHLQTNKVRDIIGRTALIESIDTVKLIEVVNRQSAAAGVVTNVLMQLHVAAEETKYGFTPDELMAFFAHQDHLKFPAVRFCGVMGMATNTDDQTRIRLDFDTIASTFTNIKQSAPDLPDFNTVSMGMSHDYRLAIACGSTMVRIGTAIFGARS